MHLRVRRSVNLLLLALAIAGAGCRPRSPEPRLDVTWTLGPQPPVVGPAALTVTVRDPSGRPVANARVRIEAQMSHPGMAPVLADAAERAPGIYEASFAYTMQGDWVLLVSIALPGGGRAERRIDVGHVRPAA